MTADDYMKIIQNLIEVIQYQNVLISDLLTQIKELKLALHREE